MALLLEALVGHETAAKQDLNLVLSRSTRPAALLTGVPPRPECERQQQPEQPAFGGPPSKADRQRTIGDVLALCFKHEGEQRLWAHPMNWDKISGDYPKQTEAAMVQQFVQLCQPFVVGEPRTMLTDSIANPGLEQWGRPGKRTLLAQAIGSNGEGPPLHHCVGKR